MVKLIRTYFIHLFLYKIYIRLQLHGTHLATVWLFPQAWRKDLCAAKWSGQRDLIASCEKESKIGHSELLKKGNIKI